VQSENSSRASEALVHFMLAIGVAQRGRAPRLA
jgi:hypothetical protein